MEFKNLWIAQNPEPVENESGFRMVRMKKYKHQC